MPTDKTAQPAGDKAPPRSKHSNRLIPWPLRPGNYILVYVQELFNGLFTPSLNPLYFLGAITFLLFWILLATGVYLFLFYEMSAAGAYESVRYITEDQKYYGGIIRSLHRYASDGIVLVIAIHIIQVLFSDRFRRYRWVAWVSGVAILPVMWFEGVSGYVLVWDETAQMIAVITADIIDIFPVNVEPIQRSFLTNDSVNSLLFFVLNYLHTSIPALLLILAWIHCMRISMPLINPPRQITIVILGSLLILSIIKPAVSAPPADLSRLIGEVNIDWFFLPFYPLMYEWNISPAVAWLGGGAGFFAFTMLPWIIREPKKPAEKEPAFIQGPISVNLEECTGCLLCQQACPFEAIKIVPRSDGLPYEAEAIVLPSRCAECGFCLSACEFDAVALGQWDKSSFKNYIESLFEEKGERVDSKRPNTIAFICERSFDQEDFFTEDKKRLKSNEEVGVMIIPCIGVLSPAIVKYSFDAGARGILVIGCRALDCHYREARRRIKFSDDPESQKFLVEKMSDPNTEVMLISPFEIEKLTGDIDAFNKRVKSTESRKDILSP